MSRQVPFFPILVLMLLGSTNYIQACIYPPTAVITKTQSGTTFKHGQTVNFSGTASEAGNCNPMAGYNWFLDSHANHIHVGSTLDYTFELLPGVTQQSFDIILRVTNTNAQVDEATMTITITKPSRVFYLRDHLGSVRTAVDEDGNVLGFDDYYPFGLVMEGHSANVANPNDDFKFTGHERDEEAVTHGIDYMNARSYDPVIGRFLQADPMHEFASPYIYVGNNPLTLIDPTGMTSDSYRRVRERKKREKKEDVIAAIAYTRMWRNNAIHNSISGGNLPIGNVGVEQEVTGIEGGDAQAQSLEIDPNINVDPQLRIKPTEDETILNDHRKAFWRFWLSFGGDINKLFGEGGRYENVKIEFIVGTLSNSQADQRKPGATVFGKKGDPLKKYSKNADYEYFEHGLDQLNVKMFVNPNKRSSKFSRNTPQHEFAHALKLIAHIEFLEEIEPGHPGGTNYPFSKWGGERGFLRLYLEALTNH